MEITGIMGNLNKKNPGQLKKNIFINNIFYQKRTGNLS